MKRKLKQKLKRAGKTTLLVLLLVSLNINPIAMISTIILDTGIVNKFSNLGQNLMYLAGKKIESVYASELWPVITPGGTTTTTPSGPIDVSIVDTPSSYFSTTENHLDWIREYTSMLGNTEISDSLYSIIKDLYDIGSGYSQNVKIDADHPEYKSYGESLAVHDEAMTARLLGVNERDMSHINAAQIEQLKQMGYDPRWVHEEGTIEEDFDKLIKQTHEYSVANVYSLNNMIGGALWRPYSDEIPYIQEFAEIVGGFASVYMGYWNTNVSTLKQPINTQRALEILGYDAILRYEGIQVLEPSKILENGVEALFIPEVVGLQKYTESPVDRNINEDPDTHESDIPDRDLTTSDVGGVPTGQSGINENIILRQVRAGANGGIEYVPEDEITAAIIPDSQIVQLYQEEIPNQEITWLDAVTVLYKALGQEQISYQTFTAYNPNLKPETSPLAKDLPGLTTFDGYNFYAFFTRANPYSGDLETGSFQAIYWRKAVNDGFVSYALRDQVISAEDFYMLAQRMMVAYGEPEMSPDEMHTLLQIYGSYYPVQLGRTVADAWEYLKCRGILTEDNEPDTFTSSLTRDQLLDICMRIKDKDSRITYKNMNLTIDVGEVLRDKDYFPVYDFELKTEEDDEFAFISTTVNYEAYDYYTYMFPVQRAVTLGYSGCGLVYSKPEKSDENLIEGALYEGKKHIEEYDYYVINVPKDYTGGIFLGFQNYDDPNSVNGTVDFIEVPSYCLGGGIYTSYKISEQGESKIATLVEPEENVTYYPFSSQSNNIDLVYYNDNTRCNAERPVSYLAASDSNIWDKVVNYWNYLTQPVEVLAAEIDSDIQDNFVEEVKSHSTLITKMNVNPDFWVDTSGNYGDGNNQIKLTDGSDTIKQVSPSAPGWFSVLARQSILSKAGVAMWQNSKADGDIVVSNIGDTVIDVQRKLNNWKTDHPNGELGRNITQCAKYTGTDSTWYTLHQKLADIAKDATGRRNLIAFAAGIKISDINSIYDSSPTLVQGELPDDVKKALAHIEDSDFQWRWELQQFNKVLEWGTTGNNTEAYTKAVRVHYNANSSGDTFEIYSKGYTNDEILGFLGAANKRGTESGVAAGGATQYVDIRSSLNTSVIMDKNEQILLCWDDLVRAGFAWGIVDGMPKISDADGTYTFMTNNGMVKVNESLHIIQIGSTLYIWPDDNTAPNLVFIDDDQNMYFDIRCVTGIINVPVTKMEKKTELLHKRFGAGSYAVYSISAKGANTSLYRTKSVSCYNYPDTPSTSGSGIASGNIFPITMHTLDITTFDTMDVGTGDVYWEDGTEGMRVLLADFNPTSNWMVTITEEGGMYEGKVYVYYLKDAFLTDKFSDGESPPDPKPAWTLYWQDQIDKQKKRCDVNHPSLTPQVKDFMEGYRSTLPDNDLWLADMTEAALYAISADTGNFYCSTDYAVRCFDVTENSVTTQPTNTDFTIDSVDASEDFRSNKPGSIYFMDYAGYVCNLPSDEEFSLTKYLSGEFVLPLAVHESREIWNFNVTWYGNANDGTSIPYGCELTSSGFINYKDHKTVIDKTQLPQRDPSDSTLPFEIPPDGTEQTGGTFKPAPAAIFARYGLLDSQVGDVDIGMISQNETMRNYYYLGNRVICISNDFSSKEANKIPFDFGWDGYNPISLSSGSDKTKAARFVGQVRRPISRSYYVLPYANIYPTVSAVTSDLTKEHLTTDDSYLWDGRPKLVAVLNMIDRGTNWLMWAVFRLAPMICVIVMTILIGLSFITDNKIWLAFCEKFFDPVRFLTLGMKDSNHWRWQDVWRRATITYIAFALFANANALRILIWAVDGWMRITEALGF